MKRTIEQCARTVAFCGALIGAMAPAYAATPHFAGGLKVTIEPTSGAATLCFKEVGLASGQTIDYRVSGNVTATYVCRDQGGLCPNPDNTATVFGPVLVTESITATKSGQISDCVTVNPPSPGAFTCPEGQEVVLSSVSYTSLRVTDTTNQISTASVSRSINRGACPAR